MGFYILLLLVIISLFYVSWRYSSLENVTSLVVLAILIVVGAFRDRIGWDYNSYTNWYINGTRDEGFEFGFLGIMKLFRYLQLDYKFLFFIFSFFTYLFAYLAIRKYTKNTTLPLVLYFLIPVLFLYSFTYVRQFLSVTIAFYACTFLLEKRYFIYATWMLIGISLHYSCFIPFILFFVLFKWGDSIKVNHLYFSIGISLIISQIGLIHWLSYLLKDSHYFYYVSHEAVPVPFMKLLVLNTMTIILIRYYNNGKFLNDYKRYLLLLYVCSVFFLNLFSESRELTRVYVYFRIFEIIVVADVIRLILYEKKMLILGLICCFYFIPYFRAIKIDSESTLKDEYKLIPYKSLLF